MEKLGRSSGLWALAILMLWSLPAIAQFVTVPSVTDNRGIDSTFSTASDSLERKAIITFQTTGASGDYRVIIDTNGPGGVERPDGQFNPDDDWVKIGMLGSATGEVQTIAVEWDGRDRKGRVVEDGTYKIRVEIDYNPNGMIDTTAAFAEETQVTVDSVKPIISLKAGPFSPNGDGSNDTALISYVLSEDVQELNVDLVNPALSVPPNITVSSLAGKSEHLITWNGKDGIGRLLDDGTYTFRFKAVDAGGNIGETNLTILIDTKTPKLISVAPSDGSMTRSPVGEISAQIADEGEAGIDYEINPPTLTLIAPDGSSVSGKLEIDEKANKLIFRPDLPISLPGQNGTYTVEVMARDKAGNKLSQEAKFTFDSQPPKVISVTSSGKTLTPGNANVILPQEGTVTFTVEDQGGSGIDFASVNVKISGPSQPASFSFTTDGVSTVTASYAGLSDEGTYTFEISFADRAGNTVSLKYPFRYILSPEKLPVVLSITPKDGSIVEGEPLAKVSAKLKDNSGVGLDLTNSSIYLTGPNGNVIKGTKSDNGVDVVEWDLITPLALDGSDDGVYTISVTPVDKTGNIGLTEQIRFLFVASLSDSVTVSPEDGTYVNSLESVKVQIGTPVSEWIDLRSSAVKLVRSLTSKEIQGIVRVEGNGLSWRPSQTLKTNGDDDGSYQVEVMLTDKSGATFQITSELIYDTQPPNVEISPSDGSAVTEMKEVSVELKDALSGFDGAGTKVSLIGPKGNSLPIARQVTDKGLRLILQSLATDGSDDGIYTLKVTPKDMAGNIGVEEIYRIAYVTSPSEAVSITPEEGTYVNDIKTIEVQPTGSWIDLQRSDLKVIGPDGNEVSGKLEIGGNKMIWRIDNPRLKDGSQDGEYRILLSLADKLGNLHTVENTLRYDSLPPTVVSTSPKENEQVSGDIEITVEASDDPGGGIPFSGLDLLASTIKLIGPDGKEVKGRADTDGVSKLIFKPDELTRSGRYTIQVSLADKAGNINSALTYRFEYQLPEASLLSTTPADGSYVRKLEKIRLSFTEATDLTGTADRVSFAGPKGPLAVKIESEGNDLIVIPEESLKTDGTDDGIYRLSVTPLDEYGNEGTSKEIQIVYDTQPPKLESLSYVQDLLAEGMEWTVNGEIERIDMRGSDQTAGIDFDASSLQLIRKADGKALSGELGTDEESRIWLILDEPLKRDGSDDGRYQISVKLLDKAGNELSRDYTLLYDTQPPTVKEVSPKPKTSVVEPIETVWVKLDDAGAGVDLKGSDVKLKGPHGYLAVNKSDDGVSTIYLSFNKLRADGTDDGTYQIEVKPLDKAGNGLAASLIYEFYYVTQKPEVVTSNPAKYSFVNQLAAVSATLKDHSGQGIDLDASSIKLIAPDGSTVGGRIEREEPDRISLMLENPLPRDGSADGQYTVEVTIADKAGNTNVEEIPFLYDTFIPAVEVEGLKEVYEVPPTEFTLKLNDENPNAAVPSQPDENIPTKGSGVDLDGTSVKLIGPKGQIPLDIKHNGIDTITISTSQISDEGSYRIEVTPKDMAGNVAKAPIVFTFTLVYAPPAVKSAQIKTGLTAQGMNYTNGFDSVEVTLTGSQVDPVASKIEVRGPSGKVLGTQEIVEEKPKEGYVILSWSPKLPFATDGTADGTYTISVTPADRLGRTGETVQFTVVYDTQPPRVNSISHIDLNAPISYVSGQIDKLEASVSDEGPSGVDSRLFTDTSIQLIGPDGKVVSGKVTSEGENKLFWTPDKPLASDGSMDGIYTVSISVVDKAGNPLKAEYTLLYDTVAPNVEFIEPKGELVTGELTEVVVKFTDPEPGRIDFDRSYVKLLDPKGREISAKMSNNGIDTVTLSFANPDEEGTYTITAMAVDMAGNGIGIVKKREFNYSTGLPVVISTTPKTSPPEEAYTGQQITRVEAKLQETNNGGISFLSQIRLRDPNGNIVPGSQSDNGVDTIIWNLAKPLATDGSDDGLYTITVIPINASGRRGDQLNFTFFYDTVPPEVDLDALRLVTSQTAQNSLSEIQVNVKDEQPSSGIDWDNVDESWIKLISPDGKPISGKATSDKAGKLIFKLDVPLATDGSQDGKYKILISPRDKAGNAPDPVEYDFVYDTTPPVIDPSSLEINGKPLVIDPNSPDFPTAVNSQTGVTITAKITDEGAGVDLTKSVIQVFSPDGNPVGGSIRQNGVDTLEFSSDLLPKEGIYKVMVKAVGLDVENLGISPTTSISTSFLFELGKPVARLTEHGPRSSYENEPAPLKGTASDPPTKDVPASGVALVEIGGYGPDDEEIEWTPAVDESTEQEEPWSEWSLDFLPTKSGKYELKIRVTDNAGNQEIYDGGELEFTVSLNFKGDVYVWPNPISRSRGDKAHFSFDVNLPPDATAQVTVTVYDVAGDPVWQSQTYTVKRGRDYDEVVTWDCTNQFGQKVATGIYVFRIEAYDGKNRTNRTGRILVVR
ncbi:Ig-like domain-containing protein [Candidatus Poribacteria bacterium]|nr:Ig-like domain-containing protein [Candidatus Poribacteria bacterium]